jgi:HEAT repeat protein
MLVGLCTNRGEPAILRGDATTLPVLLQLIRDEDSSVSNQAGSALARLPASEALWRAIVGLFKEKDPRVHPFARWLLFSFGRHADREVPSVLRELLQSEDSDVRTEAQALLQ